jgi:heme-degrading monooxygenase HmoA
MYVQFVRIESGMPDAEVRRVMEERAPQFRAIPGLLQKYYGRDPASGAYAGVYVWESERAMRAFLDTDLRRTIPQAYQAVTPPRVELYEVLFPLRPVVSTAEAQEEAAPQP